MNEVNYSLELGVAKRDITPPVGVLLAGYKTRKSVSLGYRLRAEAIACRTAEGSWILLACDLIGFRASYVESIRKEITSRLPISSDSIALCGTHTHSGPATNLVSNEELGKADRDYMEELKSRIVEAALEAYGNTAPGRFETVLSKAPDLGSNRRIQLSDGSWQNEWQDPDGLHTGYFDPTVLVAGISRPKGKLEALIVNYGCHPVVLGPSSLAISADYPGYLKNRIEGETGVDAAIFLLAGGGNINPRLCIQEDARHPQSVGSRLASVVLESLPKLSQVDGGAVKSCRVPWKIVRTRDAYKPASSPAGKKGDVIETEICAFRAGELGFIFLPGELFSEFNASLRSISPTRETLVISLANDYIGYLPTDKAQREGGYETLMAPAKELEGELMAHAQKAFGGIE